MDEDLDLRSFLAAYPVDTHLGAPRSKQVTQRDGLSDASNILDRLLDQIGGMSFGNGLYRVHTPDDVPAWNAIVATGWEETAGRVRVFAYDWLGRQFALFGEEMVLSFSAGDLEWVEIPADPVSFHNEILTNYRQEALAFEFYDAWREAGGPEPAYQMCAGYKKPLFLGGEDWIENLELVDMDVYWTITSPIIAKARNVGVGGSIGEIEVGE